MHRPNNAQDHLISTEIVFGDNVLLVKKPDDKITEMYLEHGIM